MPYILYLSYDGLTDPLGQSQILPYLAGLSQKYGYRIIVISAEKQNNYTRLKGLIEQSIEENQLIWQPVFYTKRPPVISTLWDIYQMRQKALLLHKKYNFRIVHCRSYITALVGLSLKKKTAIRFVFDMRGFWADERVEGGLWNEDNPLYKKIYQYFKLKEKEFLREADYTVSLTYGAKEEIHSWQGFQTIPIQVIPCCVDTKLFMPSTAAQTSNFPALKTSTTPFTISYLGSLGTWYMLEEMLQFFRVLLFTRPDANFLFITPDDPQLILAKAASLHISAGKFLIKKAERGEVPALLASSHISLFFIRPTYSKKASSPTKMGEILSMGIPVICNSGVGDTDYLFSAYQPGILVKDLTDEAYTTAITSIDQALTIPRQQLRDIAREYFALEKGVDLYHQVYQKLLC